MDTQIEKTDNVNQQTGMAIAVSRAENEVKAMALMAMHNPRNEIAALSRIKQACKRPGLAQVAQYAYPRGGTIVKGPSVNLARAVAGAWKNMDFGTIELEQRPGESHVLAYCIDLETNTRESRTFVVKHEYKAKGMIKKLEDPRDISEFIANQAARRLRACILGVVPSDVIDLAVEECEATLKGQNDTPIQDRIVKMVDAFSKHGVTQEMLKEKLGHNLEATIEQEYADLIAIFNSLKNGAGKREDFFKVGNEKAPDIKKPGEFMGNKSKKEEPVSGDQVIPPKDEPTTVEEVVEKEKKTEPKKPKSEKKAEPPKKEPDPRDDSEDILPETPNMPKLQSMLGDAQLFPKQLNGWAKKNKWDLADDATVCKVINRFDKIRDQIATF